MQFLAECIRIFTTWQAIPFKRKYYYKFYLSFIELQLNTLCNRLRNETFYIFYFYYILPILIVTRIILYCLHVYYTYVFNVKLYKFACT